MGNVHKLALNKSVKGLFTNGLVFAVTLMALLVAFVACTKEDTAEIHKETGEYKAISFSSYLGGDEVLTKSSLEPLSIAHYKIDSDVIAQEDRSLAESFTVDIVANDGIFYNYDNQDFNSSDLATKTQYGDGFFSDGGKNYVPILWSAGDKISIYSNAAKIGSFNSDRTPLPATNPLNSSKADYVVSPASKKDTDKDYYKRGTVTPVDEGNGLWWGDKATDHYFFASYPMLIDGAYTYYDSRKLEVKNLSYSERQVNIQNSSALTQFDPDLSECGYMYAGAKVTAPLTSANTKELELKFYPNFTAYEFNIVDKESDVSKNERIVLKSVTLETSTSDAWLSAEDVVTTLDYSASEMSFVSTLSTDVTKKSNKVTLTFKDKDGVDYNPTLPTSGSSLKFTILTLGKTSNVVQKGLKVTFDIDSYIYNSTLAQLEKISRSVFLPLKKSGGGDIEVPEGSKVIIGNSNGVGVVNGVTTLSTDQNEVVILSAESSDYCEKKLKITSRQDKSSTGSLKPWTICAVVGDKEVAYGESDFPYWIHLDKYRSSSTDAEQSVKITVNPGELDKSKSTISSPAGASYITDLTGATEVGTDSDPRDLSLYDIYGEPFGASSKVTSITDAGHHTANSYVISAPGYYCFPLVYGNAVGKTVYNKTDEDLAKTYDGFVNTFNKNITNPYILNDIAADGSGEYEAFVLWQDVYPGCEVIRDEDVSIIDAPSSSSIATKYIKFQIKNDNILPCNAVIALRDKGKNRILWSWHIWVVNINSTSAYLNWNQILSYKHLLDDNTEKTGNILNCNLGWCPPLKYVGSSKERSATLRIKQDGSNTYKDVVIKQESYSGINIEGELFSSNYYQWGRKDPFIGVHKAVFEGCLDADKPFTSQRGYKLYGKKSPTTKELFGAIFNVDGSNVKVQSEMINQPNAHNKAQTFGIYSDNVHYWWNYGQKNSQANSTRDFTAKTIYDPSPAGFCVPPGNFAKGFTNNYGTLSNSSNNFPAGALYSNSRSSDVTTHVLYFPFSQQRKGSSGRVDGKNNDLYNSDHWTSASHNGGKNQIRIMFRTSYDNYNPTSIVGITPVGDTQIAQNQTIVVRPVLEQ